MPDGPGGVGLGGMPQGKPSTLSDAQKAAVYLHNAGFSGHDLQVAVAIAGAESGYRTNVTGARNSDGTYDHGLMQINDIHHPSQAVMTDGQANANYAYSLYKGRGGKFTDWSTYNSGAYRNHMTEAADAINVASAHGTKWPIDVNRNENQNASLPSLPNPFGALSGVQAAFMSFGNVALAVIVAVVLLVVGVLLIKGRAVGDVIKKVP